MDAVYLNGQFLPLAEARVPVMDRGFLFGDGVYEVIPAYGGRPFRLAHHLQRLDNSLRAIRMESPLSADRWGEVLGRLLDSAPGSDQSLYLQVTRGAAAERDHLIPLGIAPTVFAMATPLRPRDPQTAERGIAAVTLDDIRWQRCDVKAVTLLANVLLRQGAADAGADEAILIRDGLAREGTASNLFVVRDGRIATPAKGPQLLPGVTRDLVLELASGAGIPNEERDIAPAELSLADEVWISSSSRELLPVTRLNGTPVGSGRPGPLWRQLDALFQDYKERARRGDA